MPAIEPHRPKAQAREAEAGYACSSRASEPGTISAAPSPSTSRAATRTAVFGASAQTAEAAVNTATPAQKIRRFPSRSPRARPVSISPASTRVYPSVIHWIPVSEADSSRPTTGTATLMIVTSRITMKYPAQTASSGFQGRFPGSAAGSGDRAEPSPPAGSGNGTSFASSRTTGTRVRRCGASRTTGTGPPVRPPQESLPARPYEPPGWGAALPSAGGTGRAD